MKPHTSAALLLSFSLLPLTVTQGGTLTAPDPQLGQSPDHIIVRFRPEALPTHLGDLRELSRSEIEAALNLPDGCILIEPSFSQWERQQDPLRRATAPVDPINLARHVLLQSTDGRWSSDKLVAIMTARSDVLYAEPDYVGTGGAASAPNDPYFANQWYHDNPGYTSGSIPADIRTLEAWEITTGSTNIVVAVLDTGIATGAVDFAGRLLPGYDFANGDDNPSDDHNHGSGVAGVVAANANDSSVIAGINQGCRILPVKVLNSSNSGYYSWFVDGIAFAVSNGADVINFSIGGTSSDTTLSNTIMDIISDGVIFITITHNDSAPTIRFPGRMRDCITVGATGTNDVRASFSNYGPEIDLVAPGDKIYTVSRTGGVLVNWYGTSFSCPLVAGVAGMVLGIRPDLNQWEMEALLTASADDEVGNAADVAGWDTQYGWGRLNARNALIMALSELTPIMPPLSSSLGFSMESPPNASNREPYRIEYTVDDTTWSNITDQGTFTYNATQTIWSVGSGAPAEKRVFLRTLIQP